MSNTNVWQSVLNADWAWATLAWALLLGAAVLLLWALLRSRPGLWGVPRLRCPKCWYDMTGAAGDAGDAGGFACPECGKAIASARKLRRTRRRWGWAQLAVPMLVGWHLAGQKERIRAYGWLAAVPTPMLMITVDPRDWFDLTTAPRQYLRPATPTEFLHHGMLRHDALMKIWLWRVGGLLEREGVRVVDATAVAPLRDPDPRYEPRFYFGGQYPPAPPGLDDVDAESLAGLVMRTIDPIGWVEQGGEWHTMRRAGAYLLPRATPNVVDAIEELVALLEVAEDEPARPHFARIHGAGFSVVSIGYFEDTAWYHELQREAIEFAYEAEISPVGGGSIVRTRSRGNIPDPERFGTSRARYRACELIRNALMHETDENLWLDFGGDHYDGAWIGRVLIVHSEWFGRRGFDRELERIRNLGPDAIISEHEAPDE